MLGAHKVFQLFHVVANTLLQYVVLQHIVCVLVHVMFKFKAMATCVRALTCIPCRIPGGVLCMYMYVKGHY